MPLVTCMLTSNEQVWEPMVNIPLRVCGVISIVAEFMVAVHPCQYTVAGV
jgi:hypothetical protein